jgi:hypothetical protein
MMDLVVKFGISRCIGFPYIWRDHYTAEIGVLNPLQSRIVRKITDCAGNGFHVSASSPANWSVECRQLVPL